MNAYTYVQWMPLKAAAFQSINRYPALQSSKFAHFLHLTTENPAKKTLFSASSYKSYRLKHSQLERRQTHSKLKTEKEVNENVNGGFCVRFAVLKTGRKEEEDFLSFFLHSLCVSKSIWTAMNDRYGPMHTLTLTHDTFIILGLL